MRRITTAFVFTLSATCSDLRGSSPAQAIKLNTCTATANLLFVDISKLSGRHAPPFCNHYSYKFDFVNYLCVLGFLPRRSTKCTKIRALFVASVLSVAKEFGGSLSPRKPASPFPDDSTRCLDRGRCPTAREVGSAFGLRRDGS